MSVDTVQALQVELEEAAARLDPQLKGLQQLLQVAVEDSDESRNARREFEGLRERTQQRLSILRTCVANLTQLLGNGYPVLESMPPNLASFTIISEVLRDLQAIFTRFQPVDPATTATAGTINFGANTPQ